MAKKPKVSSKEVSEGICAVMNDQKNLIFAIFEDQVHRFESKYHVYEPQVKRRKIYLELPGQVLEDIDKKAVAEEIVRWGRKLDPKFTSYHVEYAQALRVADYFQAIAEIHIKQGDIKPVREKSEKGYCFQRLDFDAKDIPTPIYDQLCENIETNKEAMEAFLGATICSSDKLQNYLWMHGQGRDGKGTLLRFCKKLLGPSYVAMVDDPKKQNQFMTSRLIGKRLGVFADCQNPAYVTSSEFLGLSGDDATWVEKKGQDGVTMELSAHYIFAANRLPAIKNSEAHIRRAIIVDFTPKQKDEDPLFEQKLWAEREGILLKWKRAYENALKNHGIKIDKDFSSLIADENEMDSAEIFSDVFKLDPNGQVTGDQFMKALKARGIISNHQVYELKSYIERTYKIRRQRLGTERTVTYKGISLRKNLDDTPIF